MPTVSAGSSVPFMQRDGESGWGGWECSSPDFHAGDWSLGLVTDMQLLHPSFYYAATLMTAVAAGIMFLGCLCVCLSVRSILLNVIAQECLESLIQSFDFLLLQIELWFEGAGWRDNLLYCLAWAIGPFTHVSQHLELKLYSSLGELSFSPWMPLFSFRSGLKLLVSSDWTKSAAS